MQLVERTTPQRPVELPLDAHARCRAAVDVRFAHSIAAAERFFAAYVDGISAAALDMARRFERGGRLVVWGRGADATDAQHVSVEFVHPVIVGKRALPALALTSDPALTTSPASASAALAVLGRPADIVLGIACAEHAGAVAELLRRARAHGMLTILIARVHPGGTDGAHGDGAEVADHAFVVGGADALVAQEVGETLYHVLWELVHLFLEHGVAGA